MKEFRDGKLFHRKQGSGRPRRARSVESIRQVERSVWEERSVYSRLQSFWEEPQTIRADIQQDWFQQDGATPHTAAASHLWLQERFPGRVISLKEEVQWAPHSPDLSPLDFFLWGYLKDRVYKDKLRTSEHLKRALIAEVSAMPSEMVDRAVDHLQTVRLPQVIRRGGAHIEHLL